MKPVRLLLTVAAIIAVSTTQSLYAQGPDTTSRTNTSLQNGGRWHFSGRISNVNPGAHSITITADSIPASGSPVPAALPYNVPQSVPIEQFQPGARVTGEMVLRNNLTVVENVQLVTAKESGQAEMKKPN